MWVVTEWHLGHLTTTEWDTERDAQQWAEFGDHDVESVEWSGQELGEHGQHEDPQPSTDAHGSEDDSRTE